MADCMQFLSEKNAHPYCGRLTATLSRKCPACEFMHDLYAPGAIVFAADRMGLSSFKSTQRVSENGKMVCYGRLRSFKVIEVGWYQSTTQIRLPLCLFSIVFTAWRVWIARTMPLQDVCLSLRLSARLSVTCRYSLDTTEHILKMFLPSGSPTILVFPYQMDGNTPTGTPLTGATNARGYEQITIFDQYLAWSRKRCKIGS